MATDIGLAFSAPAASGETGDRPVNRTQIEEQFDRLLAANGAVLSRLAGSYTDTAGDRDDLLQEIALAIWQALPRFRGECSERTFLFRIAHNRSVASLARRRSRSLERGGELEVKDPAPNPESGLAASQKAEQLRAAIRGLPVAYRQVITLTLEGLGYGEIGQVLGISESNVGARLTRARQMLKEALEKGR
jgi:RNA polymerase sigma-70 factor (ECF subfamily)